MATQPSEKQKLIPVRYDFPPKIHDKLKKYRRKISINLDRDHSMQDAIIHLISKVKL
jgi:hypothetical protein